MEPQLAPQREYSTVRALMFYTSFHVSCGRGLRFADLNSEVLVAEDFRIGSRVLGFMGLGCKASGLGCW